MRIIVDAMGGDNAPEEIVKGAVRAKRELGVDVTLVGIEDKVRACLKAEGCADGEVEVVNASEVVTMEDDPSTATRRKKDSSMAVALTMLKDGKGDAVVSAGSTGALLTGATLTVKRIRGIRRAAMAPVLPSGEHGVMLIDCGANVECTAEYLLQFAYMGSFYAKKLMGCENPRVGLLNVGTEDTKGGELQHQAFALLKEAHEDGRINFIGNVEGKTCILLDDIVDTAGSLCGAAKAIKEIGGAKEVYACATHGVLSGPALERIENSCIKEMLFLDTIPYPADKPKLEKISYLSTAPVFAEAIRRIYEEVSISNLFD